MTYLRTSLFAATATLALGLVACGGSSSTNLGQTGSGGTSGSDSGGSSSGGSGSGGDAGESSGGTTSTGAGGSQGNTGGSGGSDGGSGGSSGSSVGGSGGDGGGGYQPPQDQVDACERLCVREVAAECPNEGTLTECVAGCNLTIRLEACSDAWDALFACADEAEEVECNADGEAQFVGCNSEYNAALACVVEDGLNEDIEPECTAFCEPAADAGCENGDSQNDCTNGCMLFGSVFEACESQWVTYLECGADADFMCDAEGEPQAEGCVGEGLLFWGCVLTEYNVTP